MKPIWLDVDAAPLLDTFAAVADRVEARPFNRPVATAPTPEPEAIPVARRGGRLTQSQTAGCANTRPSRSHLDDVLSS